MTRDLADLADWLLEQIAEDERRAHEVSGKDDLWNGEHLDLWVIDDDYKHNTLGITRRRVLAECAAKQRILERHRPRVAVEGPHEGQLICGSSHGDDEYYAIGWPCADVMDMASVYAERPGYREEWRP